jgi:hypothetical protein
MIHPPASLPATHSSQPQHTGCTPGIIVVVVGMSCQNLVLVQMDQYQRLSPSAAAPSSPTDLSAQSDSVQRLTASLERAAAPAAAR